MTIKSNRPQAYLPAESAEDRSMWGQAAEHATGAGVTDRHHSVDSTLSTGEAAQLKALADEIAALPVVDIQRVREMRQRIANGSYRADPVRVAAKLLQFDAALFGKH